MLKLDTLIECWFELTLERKDGATLPLMVELATFLNTVVGEVQSGTRTSQYHIRTANENSHHTLSVYLDTFPIFSSKRLDYQDWSSAIFLSGGGKDCAYAEGVLDEIGALRTRVSGMNDNRTNFC